MGPHGTAVFMKNENPKQIASDFFVFIRVKLCYNGRMELFLTGHEYKYAVEQIMLMLFPEERPVYPERPATEKYARVRLSEGALWATATTALFIDGKRYEGIARVRVSEFRGELVTERLRQRIIKQSFYRAGVRYLGKKPAWGALSGIRPGKLMSKLLEDGLDERAAKARFIELYDVNPDRADLCLDTARYSAAAVSTLQKGDVCLYLGVPFCPTRCAYCSFVSQSVEKSMGMIPDFVDALQKDITATGETARENHLNPVAIYFGGGTPTTLSAEQLDTVITAMEQAFDLSACREFTVEAGRPDTITKEKLAVLKSHGVTRVSVNPQTMSDYVLQAIGRKHTADEVLRALACVREIGGMQVNMDLIAGLPEDTVEGFQSTLKTVLGLGVENITVHTLSLKKGARIQVEGTKLPGADEVSAMLDFAVESLRGAGYAPYYLYRQKFMSGGFENVGWCRPDTENLYNICIMEELCSILAMGGGASTKLNLPGGRIERIFAPKYPKEYIENIEKVCADKHLITDYYGGKL